VALLLDFEWLPQELTTTFGSIGLAEPETLAESACQLLANPTDELRIDNKRDVVDKPVQRDYQNIDFRRAAIIQGGKQYDEAHLQSLRLPWPCLRVQNR
jgi:hypothetical protein